MLTLLTLDGDVDSHSLNSEAIVEPFVKQIDNV